MEGRVIGQYRVTDILGEGGMGVVYAARHTLLGRPAAVKLLLPELSSKQELVQRFFNEARAATAIQHPGIVEIYDFGWTEEGAGFIVMELLQGETLRTRRKQGWMPWPAALAVTRQIAGALGAAHAKGIVHRDLKPDNIFLVPDPEVPGGERIKLLDFGVAKLVDSPSDHHKTRTGAVIGTPTYMAPEQCRGIEVDARADLYALGCILFELCSGRPPFEGVGVGDLLAAHIHVPPPALDSLMDGIPHEVEALLQRLLAKAPPDRVQTAAEVIRIIDAAGAPRHRLRAITVPPVPQTPAPASAPRIAPAETTSPVDTTLSSAVTARRDPALRAPRRRLVLGGAAAVIIVIALAGVIALTAFGSSDESSTGTPASPLNETVSSGSSGSSTAPPISSQDSPSTSTSTDAAISQQPPPTPEPRPPATVEVEITSSPSGAEVVSGGKVLGTTPFHGALPHTDLDVSLVLRLRGHVTRYINVNTGAPSKRYIQLTPIAPPAPPPPPQPRGFNPFPGR
jgi:eukaryotic-like serine/threonine-protein kinase